MTKTREEGKKEKRREKDPRDYWNRAAPISFVPNTHTHTHTHVIIPAHIYESRCSKRLPLSLRYIYWSILSRASLSFSRTVFELYARPLGIADESRGEGGGGGPGAERRNRQRLRRRRRRGGDWRKRRSRRTLRRADVRFRNSLDNLGARLEVPRVSRWQSKVA